MKFYPTRIINRLSELYMSGTWHFASNEK